MSDSKVGKEARTPEQIAAAIMRDYSREFGKGGLWRVSKEPIWLQQQISAALAKDDAPRDETIETLKRLLGEAEYKTTFATNHNQELKTKYSADQKLIRELVYTLREVVKTTDEWNAAVQKIIGRVPETGIEVDRVHALLASEEVKPYLTKTQTIDEVCGEPPGSFEKFAAEMDAQGGVDAVIARRMLEKPFVWVPVVECNGAMASTHERECTRDFKKALKFSTEEECWKWCDERNRYSKAAYRPEIFVLE